MQKQRIILIVGIVLAIVAVFMVKAYLDEQRRIMVVNTKKTIETIQANQSSVLVAKQDIARGAVISPDSLEVAIVPNKFVQPQAVTSLDRIAGMMTTVPISKGEQISLSKLTFPKHAGALADVTPIGKRAISVTVDNIAALAGLLKAGDYVDVIAMVPIPVQTAEGKQSAQVAVVPLFQNVLVLAVGRDLGAPKEERRYKQEEARETNPAITLALTPQESSLIAFVQEQGKIRLVLRSPSDSQIEPVQPASWDTLFQYIMPKRQEPPKEEQKVEQPVPPGYVEVYRGLNKEKMPMSR